LSFAEDNVDADSDEEGIQELRQTQQAQRGNITSAEMPQEGDIIITEAKSKKRITISLKNRDSIVCAVCGQTGHTAGFIGAVYAPLTDVRLVSCGTAQKGVLQNENVTTCTSTHDMHSSSGGAVCTAPSSRRPAECRYVDCPVKPCYICKKSGHTAATCPFRLDPTLNVAPAAGTKPTNVCSNVQQREMLSTPPRCAR
jgi:Zinc knuckle